MIADTSQGKLSVWKFPLPLTSTTSEIHPLRMPAGSKLLQVAEQGSTSTGPNVFVWALVDPDEPLQELRYVVMAGTGHSIEKSGFSAHDWDLSETVMCLGGRFVLHVWISRPVGKDAVEVSSDNL